MSTYTLTLGAPWEEVKEKIKERNVHLTDDDLRYDEGGEDELLERLARKMNRSTTEVKAYIESISQNKDIAS